MELKMKAIVVAKYGTPEVLEVRKVDKPAPKDNEVTRLLGSKSIVETR